ncbi:transcription termination factor Rho [Nocardioides salsibiostraticola]
MSDSADSPKKRAGGLSGMLLADLKQMAGGMGIAGAGSMKKAQLVDAIKGAQSGGAPKQAAPAVAAAPVVTTRTRKSTQPRAAAAAPTTSAEPAAAPTSAPEKRENASEENSTPRTEQPDNKPDNKSDNKPDGQPQQQDKQPDRQQDKQPDRQQDRQQDRSGGKADSDDKGADKQQDRSGKSGDSKADKSGDKTDKQSGQSGTQQPSGQQGGQQGGQPSGQQGGQQADDDENRPGRNRRRRGRDRNNRPAGNQNPGGANQSAGNSPNAGGGNPNSGGNTSGGGQREPDTTILEDDVLVPAAGILDVLDSYAFVRTSGYLPGTDDVYVSLSMVRKFGLRRGDAIMGQVRHPREGERKEKFNPMVRIDSVNGSEAETAKVRSDFIDLVPINPTERLRLETGPHETTGRIIDLVAPLGKGQRALILAPAKSGKTRILQTIAASITANNPECHLMVVLVDERPEEVTDFKRSVKGEVISSTFDRPPSDHTTAAELAIERAKRLVELGHDVVVLLDGLTRLGKAYNYAGSSTGRLLPSGVDTAALHPPKRFFGAARNVENGGSLTIVATATVDSGSSVDEVFLEEFSGTANSELRLNAQLAQRGLFPAIDAARSATRREDLLLGEQEAGIVAKLRSTLAGLDKADGVEFLLNRVGESQTNIEFLMKMQKSG